MKTFRILPVFAISLLLIAKASLGSEGRAECELLAKFVPGAIKLPEGKTGLRLAEAIRTPGVLVRAELGVELEAQGVKRLRLIVPSFDPTIVDRHGNPVTSADGEILTVPHDLSLWYVLELAHDRVEESCSALVQSPDIDVAEPNWVRRANSVPNDPYFDRQWGLRNTGQYGGIPGKDINAYEAWEDFGTGSYPVRIGVLDTGIDFNHPDFHEIEPGANFVTTGPPDDDCIGVWHGTAVSGIIGMKGDNGIGGTGVGWQLTIVPVKVLDSEGKGYVSDVAAGLDWARSQGIKVVNMSLGGYEPSSLVREAVRNSRAAGMTNVAAAGNDNTSTPQYPAGYARHCLSVNAFMMNGDRWEDDTGARINLLCGLLGLPYGSNYGATLDLTAPGGRAILTTKHSIYDDGYYEVTDPWRSCANGGITDWSIIDDFGGTSSAAPYVSGAAGLILATNPDLDGEDAEQILIRTVKDHPQYEPGWDQYSGWGRPNLYAALELASTPYVAERVTGIGGGSASFDGEGLAEFWHLGTIAPGWYRFKRYRVQRTMALETSYSAQPLSWGRVQGSIGWRRIDDGAIFDLLDEDAGTTEIAGVSASSITVRTYYYDIYDVLGNYVGRFPNGGSVRFSFTTIGVSALVGVASDSVPSIFVLRVAPNPASDRTAIYVSGARRGLSAKARISIYDVAGRRVCRLAPVGSSWVDWDLTDKRGEKVASGIYFLRLEDRGRALATRRMVVLR